LVSASAKQKATTGRHSTPHVYLDSTDEEEEREVEEAPTNGINTYFDCGNQKLWWSQIISIQIAMKTLIGLSHKKDGIHLI
jgi:hypothetical protein